MKRLFTLSLALLTAFSILAQAPQKMSYQCVVRYPGGALVTNQNVGLKISILQGTPSGTVIFSETYSPNPQTNANGMLSIEIGDGFAITGTFSAIDWASGPYFLKTETDPTGGTSYTITGTSQLLSVPFALHSKTAATANYNDLSNLPTLNISNWNTAYGWGNHAGLYRPISYVPSWSDITSKPTTLDGYGITNAMSTSHPANGITSGNITNWNTAYGWGNHSGLYRPVGWVPSWSDVTSKPSFATVATSGSYNDLSNKPTILNSQWTTVGSNIYYNTGYVGIGTSSPTKALTVSHGGSNGLLVKSTAGYSSIDIDAFNGDADLRFYKAGVFMWDILNNPSTDNLDFFEGGSGVRMTIQNGTGNVGIGDATPDATLDVEGTMVIGSNGKVFSEIREVTGTTGGAGTIFSYVSYPTGYNMSNTRVLSFEINGSGSCWVGLGFTNGSTTAVPMSYNLTSTNIAIFYPDMSQFQSRAFRLLLMKVQ